MHLRSTARLFSSFTSTLNLSRSRLRQHHPVELLSGIASPRYLALRQPDEPLARLAIRRCQPACGEASGVAFQYSWRENDGPAVADLEKWWGQHANCRLGCGVDCCTAIHNKAQEILCGRVTPCVNHKPAEKVGLSKLRRSLSYNNL